MKRVNFNYQTSGDTRGSLSLSMECPIPRIGETLIIDPSLPTQVVTDVVHFVKHEEVRIISKIKKP